MEDGQGEDIEPGSRGEGGRRTFQLSVTNVTFFSIFITHAQGGLKLLEVNTTLSLILLHFFSLAIRNSFTHDMVPVTRRKMRDERRKRQI